MKTYTDKEGRQFVYDENNNRVYIKNSNNGNYPKNNNNNNNRKDWDGFKRSGFEVRQDEKGRWYGFGWKKTSAGILKFNFSQNPDGKSGKASKGKNAGHEFKNGVLNIINQATGSEIVEPTNMFKRANGEYQCTSRKLGLILTTVGHGKTKGGKVAKGAIVRMKK